jgi:hypothetical protein
MKIVLQLVLLVITISSYGQGDSSIYAKEKTEIEMGWMFDKYPEPECGIDEYRNWINENNKLMNNSDTLTNNQVVVLEFWVDTTGNIYDLGIVQGIGYNYDKEAYRLISECPIKWIPGTWRKRKYSYPITLPVHFVEKK